MRLRDLTKNADSYMRRLKGLFEEMSSTYNKLVQHYGLNCQNCADNCCQTRFHNHTYIEYFYLMEGMTTFSKIKRKQLLNRSLSVRQQIAKTEASGQTPRVMCPLNEDGRCIAYNFRPMICRLHGVPYDMALPGRAPTRGEGCTIFQDHFKDKPYIDFDRTPLYQSLSLLERELRTEIGRFDRMNLTIAEMIVYKMK